MAISLSFFAATSNVNAAIWRNSTTLGSSEITIANNICYDTRMAISGGGATLIYMHSTSYAPRTGPGGVDMHFYFSCHGEGINSSGNPSIWHSTIQHVLERLRSTDNSPGPDLGPGPAPCDLLGNPIHGATGNKYQQEADYRSAGQFPLVFNRYYNSFGDKSIGSHSGNNWHHTFERNIMSQNNDLTIYRQDGRYYQWTQNAGTYSSTEDTDSSLTNVSGGGWLYTTQDDNVEAYNNKGKLLSITNRHGNIQTLNYSGDQLDSVSDSFGRSIHFSYTDDGLLESMTDPDGGLYQYTYDTDGNLTSVTYPDNTQRTYNYHATLPSALTSIIDERGNEMASWTYDLTTGKATSSKHAGNVDQTTIEFDFDGSGATRETNALGKQTIYHYQTFAGAQRVTLVEGLQSANCAAANQSYGYDSNGFVTSKIDWNNNETRYTRDGRGNELSRTEAFGTTKARTITTEWHNDFNLPVKITEPKRIIELIYDSSGRLETRTEKALP